MFRTAGVANRISSYYPAAKFPDEYSIPWTIRLRRERSRSSPLMCKEVSPKTIQGVDFWDEKTPAHNAEVLLMRKSSPFVYAAQKVKIDENGRFAITGGEGFKYWLY